MLVQPAHHAHRTLTKKKKRPTLNGSRDVVVYMKVRLYFKKHRTALWFVHGQIFPNPDTRPAIGCESFISLHVNGT